MQERDKDESNSEKIGENVEEVSAKGRTTLVLRLLGFCFVFSVDTACCVMMRISCKEQQLLRAQALCLVIYMLVSWPEQTLQARGCMDRMV